MILAAVFVFLYAVILSLSPAVRYHTWNVSYKWMHWLGVLVWVGGFSLIHQQVQKRLPESDPYILPCAALLTGWGLLTVWRLTSAYGARQTAWLAVSLFIFWLGLKFPVFLTWLRRYKYLSLTGILLLTTLTFFFGTYPGGTGPDLWLGCCGVYFQPSEALKLLLIIYLAAYLADRMPTTFGLLHLIAPSLTLVGAAIFLLIAQRDLGTASLLIAIYTLILYLASGKRRVLLVSLLIILAAAIVGYRLFDVIQLRVDAWLNPWLDPGGRSYQIVQSIMAYAAGGLLGSGPGLGSPGVVPVAHSDFVFTAIGEETGLIGSTGMILVLAIFTLRSFTTALRASNIYHRLLAVGISVYLAIQSILIIGGTMRLLPLTGVTLPFVSYGGTSLLFAFIALLILLLISGQESENPAPIRRSAPYLISGTVIFASFLALVLLQGWWAMVRAPALATRTDNPRRAISDRYVVRGQLLDRSNHPLAVTEGDPGEYTRKTIFPALGPILGYTNAIYGQGGLEAGLDDYLRGLRGNPASTIWSTQILYTQAPPGLDVRLSLDSNLQQISDTLLVGKTGAIVLLNAQTGEILSMSSSPTFDPNSLEENWEKWTADESAPLLNRAVQGFYPAGTTMGTFFLANAMQMPTLPTVPASLQAVSKQGILTCAIPAISSTSWADIIRAGCPGAVTELASQLTTQDIRQIYTQLGFLSMPEIPMPSSEPAVLLTDFTSNQSVLSEDGLKVTPLQMSLAAAAISNQGILPAPRIALAVNTLAQGWVILPANAPTQAMPAEAAQKTADFLAVSELPIWEAVSQTYTEDGDMLSWYIAGTLPAWQGAPLAIALIIENGTPLQAQNTGREILLAAFNPQ